MRRARPNQAQLQIRKALVSISPLPFAVSVALGKTRFVSLGPLHLQPWGNKDTALPYKIVSCKDNSKRIRYTGSGY